LETLVLFVENQFGGDYKNLDMPFLFWEI